MSESGSSSRDIRDPAEIESILELAKSHRWNFSYMVSSERRQSSHTTELVNVNARAGSLTVGSEVKYSGLEADVPVTFRAQSGGISVQFESAMIGVRGNALSNRLFSECRILFPESMKFTQLRKAIRVEAKDLDDIQVTVFANGLRLQGSVADLSTTGTKIRFEGNLTYQFQKSRIITDCRMSLPDGSAVEARVKVLGFVFDREKNVSYLRCYFLEIREEKELLLSELIENALTAQPRKVIHF